MDGLLEHTATFFEIWEREEGRKLLLLVNASTQETEPTLTISLCLMEIICFRVICMAQLV